MFDETTYNREYMRKYRKSHPDYEHPKRNCIKCGEILNIFKKRICGKCRIKLKIKKSGGSGIRERFQILSRDNFTCQYCGRKAPEVKLHIDHIIPKSKGGIDSKENYKTACQDCNLGKWNNLLVS